MEGCAEYAAFYRTQAEQEMKQEIERQLSSDYYDECGIDGYGYGGDDGGGGGDLQGGGGGGGGNRAGFGGGGGYDDESSILDYDRHAAQAVTSAWNTVHSTAGSMPMSADATPLTRTKLVEMRDGIDRLINAGAVLPMQRESSSDATGTEPLRAAMLAQNAARHWMTSTQRNKGSARAASESPNRGSGGGVGGGSSGGSRSAPTTPLSVVDGK